MEPSSQPSELHWVEEMKPFTEADWDKCMEVFGQHRFRDEMYGSWLAETEEERKLRELADQYHTRCDYFDKGLLPYDGEDRGRMNANALRVRDKIIQQGLSMGFTREQVEQAIRDHA